MSEVRCTCDYWHDGGPDVECPLHGECASYGHVGYCNGCPDDAHGGGGGVPSETEDLND